MLVFLVALGLVFGTPAVEPLDPSPLAQVQAATPLGDYLTKLTTQLRAKGCTDFKFRCTLRQNLAGDFEVEPGSIDVEIRIDVTKAP